MNYGLGDRAQVKYELPFVILDENQSGPQAGIGNSLLGFKYRFLDEDKAGLDLSLYPQVEFNNPVHSAHRGLVEEGVGILLPFQIARTFGPFGLNVDIGYEFIQHDKDRWIHGLALGYSASKTVELLGEFFGTIDQDFRHEQLILNVGGRIRLNDHLRFLFSIGQGIVGPSAARADLLVYAGLQFSF